MSISAKEWMSRIGALRLPRMIRIMNVCGGHERTVSLAGLRSILPKDVELIPGPGCPVCVCPEEDIHHAIGLALERRVILLAFGDMLRVPVNVSKGEVRSLEQARAAGADVRPIASPLEAVCIARANPDRAVVFFAVGFETTTAPVAAMLLESPPGNLFVLLSAHRTWPAVAMLLESEQPSFDALLAPATCAPSWDRTSGRLSWKNMRCPQRWRALRRKAAGRRAAIFHASLVHGLLMQARAVREEFGVRHIGLTGGVFQNRRLTEQAITLLDADGFDVMLAERLPCNDAALSFGQLVEAGARQ